MRLVVRPDYGAVSSWAAEYIGRRIKASPPGRPFALGLPTGSTPLGAYAGLAAMVARGELSFGNVVTFNMDEYVGLPEDHPQSYHRFMRENLFSRIDLPPGNANLPDGNASDLEAECARYEERIRAAGGIDLFLGGIGADGHLAFNEPGSSLSSRTRVKTLAEDSRSRNARFFGGDASKVPSTALTVGVGTIMDAREVLILASGRDKAAALGRAIEGGVSHLCAASCLQLHQRAIFVADEDATEELRVGTVRYFEGIERSLSRR
jgi:glucosamine-6-phosphate deaminase